MNKDNSPEEIISQDKIQIRRIPVESIAEPMPALPKYRVGELIEATVRSRFGSLSVEKRDLILLDTERRRTDSGEWKLVEIAAARIDPNNGLEFLGHRCYRHADIVLRPDDTIYQGKELREWSDTEAAFWKGSLEGHVLVGHHIGSDLDQLTHAGIVYDSIGLLDSLELALLVFPLAEDDEGRRSHALHDLASILGLDRDPGLQEFGRAHEARYDIALCWQLVIHCLRNLSAWPELRQKATLQLLSPESYLRRFLEKHLSLELLPVDRVPFKRILGSIPEPPETRPELPALPWPVKADEVLGERGPFSQLDGFQARPIQMELAATVQTCLDEGGTLVAEAGTGTGKSLAALVPALLAAQANPSQPVVISTYTHLLQNQLAHSDLPKVEEALGRPVRTVVLKGRGNYLDLETLDAQRTEHLRRLRLGDRSIETGCQGLFLAYLLNWICEGLILEQAQSDGLKRLFTGDLSEPLSSWFAAAYGKDFSGFVLGLQELPPLLDETGSKDNLPVLSWRAVKFARSAELVITNHSFWLLSRPLREIARRVIFDEAHHLEDAVTGSQTLELSADLCRSWARTAKGISRAVPGQDRHALFQTSQALEEAVPFFASLFRRCLDAIAPRPIAEQNESRSFADDAPYSRRVWISREGIDYRATARRQAAWLNEPAGRQFAEALQGLLEGLVQVETDLPDEAGDIKRLARRLLQQVSEGLGLLRTVQDCNFEERDSFCWWIEEDERDISAGSEQVRHFVIKRAPIRVGEMFRQLLLEETEARVFLSATLSLRGGESIGPVSLDAPEAFGFRFLCDRLGLDSSLGTQVWSRPSPFEYTRQMRVLLRQPLRSPSDPEEGKYLHELHAELLNLLRNAPNKGLVLFTSRRHLTALGEAVKDSLKKPEIAIKPGTLLLQQIPGESASRLVEVYRSQLDESRQALIFGTGSFWEGVDLSGEYGLDTLVIVRLPFPVAGEPLIEARSSAVEDANRGEFGGAFLHYLLPLTLLRWRQGIGRLVRDRHSRGVVICLDRRAVQSNYANEFLRALPAGPGGRAPVDRCVTMEELLVKWAEFSKRDCVEMLDIVQQPWQPARFEGPKLEDHLSVDEQAKVLDETARRLVGEGFRRDDCQLQAMQAFSSGKDVLLVMPTGGGKSLCYQVPALAAPDGLTIVFSPLRALIQNQVNELERSGIPIPDVAGYLLGRNAQDARLRARVRQLAEDHKLKILYLTPEMAGLDFSLFPKLDVRRIVIDEAHCLLTWGSTFRPDYLRLAQRICRWRERDGQSVAVMACSATLPPESLEALQRTLGLREPVIIRGNADRPNLYWGVDLPPQKWGMRDRWLQETLARLPAEDQAIIYTTYTRTCEQVEAGLIRHGFKAAAYHAKKDALAREIVLTRFENGPEDLQVIVATKAFGMGINNRRVSLVIHYNHPENLTEYYQQAGRAGRNRNRRGMALTVYDSRDQKEHAFLQKASQVPEVVLRIIVEQTPLAGGMISERRLVNAIDAVKPKNDKLWESSRLLYRGLELLATRGVLGFQELVASAKLTRFWDCPSSPPDELHPQQQEILSLWLPKLIRDEELTYQADETSLEACLLAESLLGIGVEKGWWRVSFVHRQYWLQPSSKQNIDLSELIKAEQDRYRAELDEIIKFLEDDSTCRRKRIVQAFNPQETVSVNQACCDVCQVEAGLGHPWLDDRPPVRFLGNLVSAEANLARLLEENRQPEVELIKTARYVVMGSHLENAERIRAFLRRLQERGLSEQVDGVWRLTKSGENLLDQNRFPTWIELF